MTVHYNAFISYNHNPRDMKIAALLQQKLEHFRAPMRVKADSRAPHIERVFLDKGELGVSMDLNDEIQTALQNSDYLIVICSPESMTSIWVQREISFFLQSHTVDRILTVITAGEPPEVLPEVLLSKEVVDEDGTVRPEIREPLSCDYRLPVRKANKVELPRLVAAILGIRYDDLMQRQRHYRMVRLAAIGSTAMVLMVIALGYLIWSNQRIRENYENTLREQSRALSLQSEEALNEGDRLLAIEYALEALPSEDEERPVVSEAVYALASAEGVYQPPDDSWLSTVRSLYDFEIIDCFLDKDKNVTRLAGFQDRRLSVIDLASGKDLCADYGKELQDADFYGAAVYGEDRLLLLTSEGFKCYDVAEGRELWSTDLTSYGGCLDSIYPYEDHVWVPVRNYDEDYRVNVSMVDVDAATGEVRGIVPLSADHAVGAGSRQSENGRWVSYWSSYYSDEAINDEEKARQRDVVVSFDAATGETAEWETDAFVTDALFDNDGSLTVCQILNRPSLTDDGSYGYGIFEYNLRNRRKYFTLSRRYDIRLTGIAANGQDLAPQWEKEYREMCNGVPRLDIRTDIAKGEPSLYFTVGNILHVFNESGEEAFTVHFSSPVMAYHFNGSDGVNAVLHSGQFGIYNRKNGELSQIQFFSAPVTTAVAESGMFFIECPYGDNFGKYKVLQYCADRGDPKWQEYPESRSQIRVFPHDGAFIEVPRYPKAGEHVTARDVVSGEVLWDCELPVPEGTMVDYYHLAEMDEQTGQVVFVSGVTTDYNASDTAGRYTLHYLTVDAATGEIRQQEAGLSGPDGNWPAFSSPLAVDNGKIYLLGSDTYYECESFSLESVQIEDGSPAVAVIEGYQSDAGLTEHTDQSFEKRSRLKDGLLLIRVSDPETGDAILVYGPDGVQKCRTESAGLQYLAMTVFEGKVCMLALDGQKVRLVFFDAESGRILEDPVINGLEEPNGSKIMRFDLVRVSEDEILIQLFNAGALVNTKDWTVLADINGLEALHGPTGVLYLEGSANGHVPLRTTEELITLGHEILGTE